MQKILLTGSFGFVGSNFVRNCIYEKKPYQLVSVDAVLKDELLNNIYINRNHSYNIGNLNDLHFMKRVFQLYSPDIVIHMAGTRSADFKDCQDNNILATKNLVDLSNTFNVKKFIYLSDSIVYKSNDKLSSESSDLELSGHYRLSKIYAENIVSSEFNNEYLILRSSTIYGNRQRNNFIHKVAKRLLIDNNLDVKSLNLHHCLETKDNYINIFDLCSSIFYLLENNIKYQTINVATESSYSKIDVIKKILNTLSSGKHKDLSQNELRKMQEDDWTGAADDLYSVPDPQKLLGYGWKPSFSFDDGLKNCIDWYVNNEWALK